MNARSLRLECARVTLDVSFLYFIVCKGDKGIKEEERIMIRVYDEQL